MKVRYSYAEAADALGISKSKLYRRIYEGRLTPVRDGQQPFITAQELERYANTEQPNLEPYRRQAPAA